MVSVNIREVLFLSVAGTANFFVAMALISGKTRSRIAKKVHLRLFSFLPRKNAAVICRQTVLVDEARKQDKRIFVPAFHVDYWNYLGWKDIYAKAEYSDRQRRYAEALETNRIYAPQMIVNGDGSSRLIDREQALVR